MILVCFSKNTVGYTECNSERNTKNGIIKGVQRYKCKECGFNFIVELKRIAKPENAKGQALRMYLEGLGFHSIGRFLKVGHVLVLNWVKEYGSHPCW